MIKMHTTKPSILVIDDEPNSLRDQVTLGLDKIAEANVVHPNDIEMSDLESADLVLVDYLLDNWEERDAQLISLRPGTGIALSAVLREQVDQSQNDRLTAFALHTSHLGEIKGRLPSTTARHVLARLNNLEWVFPKTEPLRYHQMGLLADAVRQLPKNWPQDSDGSPSVARNLLAIGENDKSFERCWRDIQECRVPVHELIEGGHGLLFVRWLLHQVLPYPSFLWEEHWVAARLRCSVDALRKVMAGNSHLAEDLRSMRYSGILAGFLGDRWWRGVLEDYVWELAGHASAAESRLREALNERAEMELVPTDAKPVVVCLDANLEPAGQFLSPMTAVTLRPDFWPAFADSALTDIETVQHDPTLLSMVDPLDLYRIKQ